jgi:hypothetical protein
VLLEASRTQIQGSRFKYFVTHDSRVTLDRALTAAREAVTRQTCEVELVLADGIHRHGQVEATFSPDTEQYRLAVMDTTDRWNAEAARQVLVADLQAALAKVKLLSGMLPICAWCNKVRDDDGYWEQVEVYIAEHSDAVFSHGICPECADKLYSDMEEEESTPPGTPPPGDSDGT